MAGARVRDAGARCCNGQCRRVAPVRGVSATEDEHPVETLGADGADEAFCVGIRLRRTHGRADDSNAFAAEYLVEGTGELAVSIVDQEAFRSNRPVKLRLRACWSTHAPVGFDVHPAKWTRRLAILMKNST